MKINNYLKSNKNKIKFNPNYLKLLTHHNLEEVLKVLLKRTPFQKEINNNINLKIIKIYSIYKL
jgi:hypothetical protein